MLLLSGCASPSVVESREPFEVDRTAESLFGRVTLAQGQSITLDLNELNSVDDVRLAQFPPPTVAVSLSESESGVPRLTLEIDPDHPAGTQDLVFDVDGKPNPIIWTILVTDG